MFDADCRKHIRELEAVVAAGRRLAAAAYDMAREPENDDDVLSQHMRLNDRCAEFFDIWDFYRDWKVNNARRLVEEESP